MIADVADLSGALVTMPAEDLFVDTYVLVDDLITNELVVIPTPRSGPWLFGRRDHHDRAGQTRRDPA
ncbi:MAG: hypothetical protein ACRCYX_12665 [Dermatophilaceae bacterium]